jgi:hypothetical protein
MADRSEILLITENKTVILEMESDGKFSAKSNAWEENKVVLEGEELVVRVVRGRWFIVKQKQAAGGVFADRPVIAAGAADEILEAPVTTNEVCSMRPSSRFGVMFFRDLEVTFAKEDAQDQRIGIEPPTCV